MNFARRNNYHQRTEYWSEHLIIREHHWRSRNQSKRHNKSMMFDAFTSVAKRIDSSVAIVDCSFDILHFIQNLVLKGFYDVVCLVKVINLHLSRSQCL